MHSRDRNLPSEAPPPNIARAPEPKANRCSPRSLDGALKDLIHGEGAADVRVDEEGPKNGWSVRRREEKKKTRMRM